jgi:hypothetical protein
MNLIKVSIFDEERISLEIRAIFKINKSVKNQIYIFYKE